MPAKRKPTAVLEASGAFAKDPARARERANEPRPDGPLGPPPADFLRDTPEWKKHLAAWNRIIEIAPPGVLTKSDWEHVNLTARLMVKCDQYSVKDSTVALLLKYLDAIGCTPVGRTRIHVEHGAKVARDARSQAPEGWAALDQERSTQGGLAN